MIINVITVLITNKSLSVKRTTSLPRLNTSNYLVILSCYFAYSSVTQNSDAVLTSRDKITKAIVVVEL